MTEATWLDDSSRRAAKGTAVFPNSGDGGYDATAKGRPLPLPPSKVSYLAGYRLVPPPLTRPNRSFRCFLSICVLWIALLLFVTITFISVGVFYLVDHPRPPSFSVSSLRLSALDVSSGDAPTVTSRIELTVTARNPNRKMVLRYGDIVFTAYSNGVEIADGTVPGFFHGRNKTKVISAEVASTDRRLEPSAAAHLRSWEGKFPLKIEFQTKAGVRIGGIMTKGVGIRALCNGINAAVANGGDSAASPLAVKCKVKIRIGVFRWTV